MPTFGDLCTPYEVTIYMMAGAIGGAIACFYVVAYWPGVFGLRRTDGT